MKNNKTLILFLVKFFISYFVLVGLYSIYLNKTQQKNKIFVCSPITSNVAKQSAKIINSLGYKIEMVQHKKELSIKTIVNNKYVARVIEGCNAISVIILFLAFIIAFSGSIKATILYGLIGSLLIYIINIFRIALISIAYLEHPKYQDFLHDLVFPTIIYGFVFLLWVVWVNKFSDLKKTKNE